MVFGVAVIHAVIGLIVPTPPAIVRAASASQAQSASLAFPSAQSASLAFPSLSLAAGALGFVPQGEVYKGSVEDVSLTSMLDDVPAPGAGSKKRDADAIARDAAGVARMKAKAGSAEGAVSTDFSTMTAKEAAAAKRAAFEAKQASAEPLSLPSLPKLF